MATAEAEAGGGYIGRIQIRTEEAENTRKCMVGRGQGTLVIYIKNNIKKEG